MRLATFNLLHGVSVSGADPASLRPLLDERGRPIAPAPVMSDAPLRESARLLDADVLGLQEVDVHQERSGRAHQVRAVAEALDAPFWMFVPALRGTPGLERDWQAADAVDHRGYDDDPADVGPRYGVGLVSRHPVLAWRATLFDAAPWSLPLVVPAAPRPRVMRIPDEPRVAVAALIDTPRGRITVATAHLSFVPGYNVRQLRQLRTWLATMPRPLVLLGDFNLPGSLPRRITGWSPLVSAATYPSTGPRVQFDHVLADGLTDAQRLSVRPEVHTLPVSDHCAVSVDLTL